MPVIPEFSQAELERVSAVLADTGGGLTGSEIGRLLALLDIPDPSPGITKRHRLFNALAREQTAKRSGNIVGAFIEEAMRPLRYASDRALFESRRNELNTVLVCCP